MPAGEILHVTGRADWDPVAAGPLFRADSLLTEGVMHCCTESQLAHVLTAYFQGRQELVLLRIDPGRLTSELRWEGGFPHLYGPLDTAAVVSVEAVE